MFRHLNSIIYHFLWISKKWKAFSVTELNSVPLCEISYILVLIQPTTCTFKIRLGCHDFKFYIVAVPLDKLQKIHEPSLTFTGKTLIQKSLCQDQYSITEAQDRLNFVFISIFRFLRAGADLLTGASGDAWVSQV